MLKELIRRSKRILTSQDIPKELLFNETKGVFFALVDFLSDPQRFPNDEINRVTELMWGLLNNSEILLIQNPQNQNQKNFPIVFSIATGEKRQRPLIIMPKNLIDQTRKDVIFQLGEISYIASQCRDYYTERLTREDDEIIMGRSRAFEAETLWTLQQMAFTEGILLRWNDFQQHTMKEFPTGLSSLPHDLDYPTPIYTPWYERS